MKLNSNTFQTSVYKWFHATNKLPNNLCPYFWGLVIMYMFFIPYAIVTAPFFFINRWVEEKYKDEIPTAGIFAIGIILWVILIMLISMVAMWFTNIEVIKGLGLTGYLFTCIGLFVWGIDKFKKRRDSKREARKDAGLPVDGLLVVYAKSWYERYCPIITWNTKLKI